MRWTIQAKPTPQKVAHLAEKLGVESVIASLLVQRGIDTYEAAKHFFRPNLDDLHDPFSMKDMEKAVMRIESAITANENILVYGDYDVDGTTSVALLSSFLLSYYPRVATYIPDRYGEGYGISFKGIDFAEDNDFSLIIALDCGIKAIDKVKYASEKGIDFIICDHHRPAKEIPNAIAVLDPKREDCEYPFKELCGCGVGFKLIQALASKKGETIQDLVLYLDLVATAIGADIVPVTGENRILAYHGLQVINNNPRPGFKAILQQVKKETLTITDVVFIIAPRINAAGRMKHGNHAVTLLCETDPDLAAEYASEIDQFNTDRREADKRITEEALSQIKEQKEEKGYTTVVYDKDWHKGVIGIVAGRLKEKYNRPVAVIAINDGIGKASCRSIKGVDFGCKIIEAKQQGLLVAGGGHSMAAGFTVEESKLQDLQAFLNKEFGKEMEGSDLHLREFYDANLTTAAATLELMSEINQLEPFGVGNPAPVFRFAGVYVLRADIVGSKHIRVIFAPNKESHASKPLTAIAFNVVGSDVADILLSRKSHQLAVFGTLKINKWQDRETVQLQLRDVQIER